MENINDAASERTQGQKPWGLLLWPMAFMLLYALSFGPVDLLFGVGSPAVRAVYAPLLWTYKSVAPFRIAFDAYMVLWDEHW